MEQFIRYLIIDVLAKSTIDKVLRSIRKLDWDDPEVKQIYQIQICLLAYIPPLQIVKIVHKLFTKPWKIRYSNIGLLAMLTYDLQRYHPSFAIAVIDQVLEDVRFGLEVSLLNNTMKIYFSD